MDMGTACPGCGEVTAFAVTEKLDEFTMVRCPACDLEFSQPMKGPGGKWYDDAYVIRHSAIDDRIREYFRWAVATIPTRGRLLDIGCGEGVFVRFAGKKGFDAAGTDFSTEATDLGRMLFGLTTLYNASLADLKRIHGLSEFDAITFFEALEHMENPSGFLDEVKSMLRDGGYVVASVPLRDRWPVRDITDYPPHHLTRWTEKSLCTLFAMNGFDVVAVKASSRLGSYAQFLGYGFRSLAYWLLGFRKGLAAQPGPAKSEEGARAVLKNPAVKRFLSLMKPRQVRDIIVWPVALLTFPLFFPFFRGANIMLMARKRAQ